MTDSDQIRLSFVSCASNAEVLGQRLLASPCLQRGGHLLAVYFNAASAAEGFNATLAAERDKAAGASWLVWLHQDVFLPEGWDTRFTQALVQALQQFPKLAVAGVYGLAGAGAAVRRAGHVLDRGALLRESTPLPCLVDSLDELLFAVRVDAGLQLDPALGFDFYATDLVLQAQQCGLQCAVLDACCEHWSDTPTSGVIAASLARRIETSGAVFEAKWAAQLPVQTSWLLLRQSGDVARFVSEFEVR